MRKLLFSALIAVCFLAVSIQAQRNYRIEQLSSQLQRSANDLADRAYNDFTRRSYNNRSDVDALLAAQQLSASANVFSRMVTDNRQNSELRDMANALNDLARRSSYGSGNSYQVQEVQRAINDISNQLGGFGNNNGNNNGGYNNGNNNGGYNNGTNNGNNNNDGFNDRPIVGNVSWKGMVDDTVQITIRNNSFDIKTLSGQTYPPGNYNFTSPLPDRRVDVEVDKKKGRGSVRVLQQPRRENNFTTVIEIKDKDGGAKEYELEIYWR